MRNSAQSDDPTIASPAVSSFRRRVDSIEWYCELRGHGPNVVLIPSGEGDCASFERTAATLSANFTVLAFDMPGFSRSTDPPDFAHYSMDQAASEVAALVQSLGLGPSTFYGCSSGGQLALRLAADHSDLVWRVVVHEVPLSVRPQLSAMTKLSDDEIIRVCKELFQNQMNENMEAWLALGEAYHQRLERNYVTWVRRYLGADRLFRPFTPEELRRRPVTWTIGGLTPAAVFFENVVIAHNVGIQVGLLMCKHFPQVTMPDLLADHIGKVARGQDDPIDGEPRTAG
jgi:pimeloyl-ACP methyl ester carboxylesterase